MPRRLAIGTLISAADQALLSLFSLALSLAFIRGTDKSEFATFTLMFMAVQLLQSVQNALVSSPLLTLVPARDTEVARSMVLEAGLSWQRRLMAAVVVVSSVLALAAFLSGQARWGQLVLSTGVAGIGVMARELGRSIQFLRRSPQRALAGDATYVCLAAAGMVAAHLADRFSAPIVLTVLGLAGLCSNFAVGLAGHGVRTGVKPMLMPAAIASGRAELWGCARWALPSVVNSWIYANGYLFAVEAWLGKESVADLSAARLLLVPLTLLMTGWSMSFRPRAAQWLAEGSTHRLQRVVVVSARALVGVSSIYGLALWLGWMPLVQPLLGPGYAGIEPLLVAWLVFYTVANVRGVGMSAMLASPDAFRTLFLYGVVATLTAAVGVIAALAAGAVPGVLAALVAAECVLAILIWSHGWPAIRRGSAVRTGARDNDE